MDVPGRKDKNLYTYIWKGVSKNVDEPSKENLIGIWPSFRKGSKGTVTLSAIMTPNGPEESAASVAGTIVLKYFMDGILPGGTFDKDNKVETCDVEFLAIEKG